MPDFACITAPCLQRCGFHLAPASILPLKSFLIRKLSSCTSGRTCTIELYYCLASFTIPASDWYMLGHMMANIQMLCAAFIVWILLANEFLANPIVSSNGCIYFLIFPVLLELTHICNSLPQRVIYQCTEYLAVREYH